MIKISTNYGLLILLGETLTETTHPTMHHSDHSMSYFVIEGPGKEHRTKKP